MNATVSTNLAGVILNLALRPGPSTRPMSARSPPVSLCLEGWRFTIESTPPGRFGEWRLSAVRATGDSSPWPIKRLIINHQV